MPKDAETEDVKGAVDEPEKKPKAGAKKADKFVPKAKPELSQFEIAAIQLRSDKKSKTPHFKRQEWFRYQKLGDKWRKPRGLHSKMRRHIKYRPNVVSIGYRGPKAARGRHPSGFEEVMVHNLRDMDGLNPKRQAVRIAHSVGYLKRMHIAMKAEESGLRILNFSRKIHDELLAEAKKRSIELPSESEGKNRPKEVKQ